jgi:hypothetical protein
MTRNYDDSPDDRTYYYDFALDVIKELKQFDGWDDYPESVLNVARDIFVEEQLEADYHVEPTEQMLAIMFYSNLQWAKDDALTNLINNPPALIISHTLSGFHLTVMPPNPHGYSHALTRSEPREYLAPLTPQQAEDFYTQKRLTGWK